MKIKLINIYSFPVRANTDWLILEIVSENNIKGYSELTMSNYYKRDELISITKKLIKKLSNKDVENDNKLKGVLEENKEESLIFNTSISGIRSACSDIFSKIKKVPMNIYLAEMKKRKISNSVELYANINRSLLPNNDGPVDRSSNSFFNMAKKAKNAGFKKIKCAPFDGFKNEEYEDRKFISGGIDKVSLISKNLKNEIEILVDCHSKFNLEESQAAEKDLYDLGVKWFEEPMDPQKNLDELKELKLHIKGKLVGGEEFYGVNKFYTLIENNFFDIVMPDIKYCGGIEEAMNIGIKLESISDDCFSIHCPSGPISLAGSAHVTSALSSELPLEHAVFEIEDRHEFVYPNENITNGKYIFNNNFGIGVVPNFSKENKHLLKDYL
tara:strand:+ start:699 stop:1850 length:1152 start_codon:yes stop_codon:yes gene_type:complete